MIILFLGAFYIVREQQTNFKNLNSVYGFGKTYVKWVGQLGKNITALVVSAYKMKWLPYTNQQVNNNQPNNQNLNNSVTINLPT